MIANMDRYGVENNPMMFGFCDVIQRDEITGWAMDSERPGEPVYIDIYINGNLAKTTACKGFREDVAAAGYPTAEAFFWNPVRSLSNGQNLVEVRFKDGKLVAQGSGCIEYNREEHIGGHWSDTYQDKRHLLLRWWHSDRIVKHINKKVCGEPFSGLSRGLFERVAKTFPHQIPFQRAVSVGAGDASKELQFVNLGLAREFDLFELSEYAVKTGERHVKTAGLEEQMIYRRDDPFRIAGPVYDVVFWNNALHHMFDVDAAIRWSWDVLKPGGLFVMDEFVGPTRMQWSDLLLAINTRFRTNLPEPYLDDPLCPGTLLATKMERPDLDSFYAIDPSECADSGRILPSIERHFPEAKVILTGGGIYHLGLNDVLHNVLTAGDVAMVDTALMIDDACVALGETHYAVAMACKGT